MKHRVLLFCVLFIWLQAVWGTVFQVGPSRPLQIPSQAAALVDDGDTVDIDPVTYSGTDACAVWTKHNLLVRGAGGVPHMQANGASVQGKGTWVVSGDNMQVESVAFSGSVVPDHNGAGIRHEGSGLTVRHCHFHYNENGILGGHAGIIVVEYCEFGHNGYGDGYSHNIYINHAQELHVRFSYFHHAHTGHEIKSRAHRNFILYNRISNESTGDASREVDLPNGGLAVLTGNIIHQGPAATNGNMLGFGSEGLSNDPPHELYLVNNTIVDERGFGGSFISLPASGVNLLKAVNNIFVSATAAWLIGSPSQLDSLTNIYTAGKSQLFFADTLTYDYRLTGLSLQVIDQGSFPGYAGSFLLQPTWEYQHPCLGLLRPQQAATDIGAYEYVSPAALPEAETGLQLISCTGNGICRFRIKPPDPLASLEVYDANGRLTILGNCNDPGTGEVDLSGLPCGLYLCHLRSTKGKSAVKFIHCPGNNR